MCVYIRVYVCIHPPIPLHSISNSRIMPFTFTSIQAILTDTIMHVYNS